MNFSLVYVMGESYGGGVGGFSLAARLRARVATPRAAVAFLFQAWDIAFEGRLRFFVVGGGEVGMMRLLERSWSWCDTEIWREANI